MAPLFRSSLLGVLIAGAIACSTVPGGGDGPDIKSPGPDFGFIPNAIGIVRPGRLYVETSVEFDHGPDGARSWRVPILFRAGVSEDLEARALVWAVQGEKDATGRETGSGPIQLGIKNRISKGGGTALDPAFGFEIDVILPASTGGFDDGTIVPDFTLNFDHTLAPGGVLTWNIGIIGPVDSSGDSFVQGFFAAAWSWFVIPDVQLYATGSINYPADGSGSDPASVLGAGGYWYLDDRVVLFAGYNFGLTSESPDGAGVVGLSFAF